MSGENQPQLRASPSAAVPEPSAGARGIDAQSPSRERGSEHWRSVLGGMSPREVLARLLQGDPLELRQVVAARLAQRAYLFDADRVHLRALAHCARYAVRYRGTPAIEIWLAEIVDQALIELLREDVEAEKRGAPVDSEELAALVDLARPLGLEPAAMRRVCLAHNLLREPERQAFHGLVIAGRGLEEVARALGASGVEVARLARRGLEAVLIASGQASEISSRGRKPDAGPALSSLPESSDPNDAQASRAPSADEVQP
ncbi:MAG TPA: hypothetical protein VK843_22215 [Planctomycetota bacterium]|nr:hypothetical protein [Planctomycetota bacterium]